MRQWDMTTWDMTTKYGVNSFRKPPSERLTNIMITEKTTSMILVKVSHFHRV